MFKEYAQYYNLIYKKRAYKAEAEMVYRWAGKPSLIVDLGCGTGLHHKYWKCSVIGIEQSNEMLKQVKPRKNCVYIQADIETDRNFIGMSCYTALFNVVGYCNLDMIMGRLQQEKGGIFIFDVWDMDKFEKSGGFQKKIKKFKWGNIEIFPHWNEFKEIILEIKVAPNKREPFSEFHSVLPYPLKHIEELCQKYGYIGIKKNGTGWTTWYKLVKQ